MATQTKVIQSGLQASRSRRMSDYANMFMFLLVCACFGSTLCTDYCLTDCNFPKCICTDKTVECHNETTIKGDIVELYACIKDHVVSVTITGSSLVELPANLLGSCKDDTTLRLDDLLVLNLSGNGIREIHGKTFHCMPKLQTLDLSHNDWMIDFHAQQTGYFTSLPELRHLNLTNAFDEVWKGNIHIKKLADVFFDTDMAKLETLSLAQNELFTLSEPNADAFCELTSLKTLDLSRNKLTMPSMPTITATECLENLEVLDFAYNKMPRLTKKFMDKLDKLEKLQKVYLGHNDYFCDCTLLDTYHWLDKRHTIVADIDDVKCTDGFHSSYINKTVLELTPNDLQCLKLPVQSNKAVRVVTGIIFTAIALAVIIFLIVNRAHVRRCLSKGRQKLPSLNLRPHVGYSTVQEEKVAHL